MHLGYYKSNFVSTSTILPVNFRAKCVSVLQRHLRQISEKLDFALVAVVAFEFTYLCLHGCNVPNYQLGNKDITHVTLTKPSK